MQARIGPVDRIFTRIGASDDISSGRSTFMVEMTETANILRNATRHSLVLLDEIGRGTSTFDGLSLAWACAQTLATENQAYTLFATHYFELTALAEIISTIHNVHFDAIERDNQLIFQHTVKPGSINDSYGLQVAALAGVPQHVIQQARHKLQELEAQRPISQTDPQPPANSPEPHPLVQALKDIDPENLTPKQALDLIFQLKKRTTT